MGQGLGPGFTTVAARRSVILSADGIEFVFTFRCAACSAAASRDRRAPPQDSGRGLEQIPPAYFAIPFQHCRFLLSVVVSRFLSGNHSDTTASRVLGLAEWTSKLRTYDRMSSSARVQFNVPLTATPSAFHPRPQWVQAKPSLLPVC
jgi:hypothetical protein